MTAESAIRVQGVEKSFKNVHVLRGVDFDVARGSIFALLGSNGAGKTTLIRILSTLLKADAGKSTVHGFDVATEPGAVRESISLTGQFAAVDDVLTGRENLVLVARLRHLTNPGEIADDLLARFSLTDAGDRRAGQYLDEAEHLADRIAILHKGTIIQNGTLAELKQLLPPAQVEYVEKQPSLEDVFLALVGDTGEADTAETDTADDTADDTAPTRKERR